MPPASNVHVGVAAVVRRMPERELLLVQRGGSGEFASDGYGTWGLPGGWLEFGELPFAAAEREVLEETAVSVRALEQDGYEAGVSDNGRFHIVTLFVRCDWTAGDVRNREPDKHLNVRWMPEELLPELDLFAPLDRWWRRPR